MQTIHDGARAPRAYRRSAGDKSRRARWLEDVATSSVSRGCRAWALTLSKRSSATAKPVWGYQTGQADEIGCSARQVRRYRSELERAGLVETERGEVIRYSDGRYSQQMTNRYRFVVPPRPKRQKPSSHRADTDDRLNPIPTGCIETYAPNLIPEADEGPPIESWAFDRSLIGAAKKQLRGSLGS
jgi:hypothetical protein